MLDILKIDVDAGERVLSVAEIQGRLARAGKKVRWLKQERSRSGQGWHISVCVSPPCDSFLELVVLQAVCGSDPYREANNLMRAKQVQNVPKFWRRVACVSVFYDPVY